MMKYLVLFLSGLTVQAHAALETIQRLHFGELAITSTAVVSRVTVPISGVPWSDGAIHIIKPGRSGLFRLTELTPHRFIRLTPLTPQIADPVMTSDGFELISVDMPTTLTTDANGTATFPLGGVIRTRLLTGEGYLNTEYRIFLTISIDYE